MIKHTSEQEDEGVIVGDENTVHGRNSESDGQRCVEENSVDAHPLIRNAGLQ